MRIITVDFDDGTLLDIDAALRQLVAASPSLEAAKWQKLLELVVHLQLSACEHELWGQIVLKELWLDEPSPPDPTRERQMKRFMEEWCAQNPDPKSWGRRLTNEMKQRFPPKPKVQVIVRIDWNDYARIRDGRPEMHYRFQVKRPEKTISEDARAMDVVQAERIIHEAFGWQR